MNKVKFVPRHNIKKCYYCTGKGCKRCHGTGKYIDTHYHLIYKDKNGQKMAFSVDGLK